MDKYECDVCGYVYEGENLPEDFLLKITTFPLTSSPMTGSAPSAVPARTNSPRLKPKLLNRNRQLISAGGFFLQSSTDPRRGYERC